MSRSKQAQILQPQRAGRATAAPLARRHVGLPGPAGSPGRSRRRPRGPCARTPSGTPGRGPRRRRRRSRGRPPPGRPATPPRCSPPPTRGRKRAATGWPPPPRSPASAPTASRVSRRRGTRPPPDRTTGPAPCGVMAAPGVGPPRRPNPRGRRRAGRIQPNTSVRTYWAPPRRRRRAPGPRLGPALLGLGEQKGLQGAAAHEVTVRITGGLLPASGSLALYMAITVGRNTLGGTIAPRSRHDPSPEGPAPTPHRHRTPRTPPAAPVLSGPCRPGRPRRRPPAGQRGARLSGSRPGGRPQERRRRLAPGRPVQPRRPDCSRTAARRRPGGGLRRGGSRPHPAGGRTDAHSGAGRDGDLVPLDPAARAAFGPPDGLPRLSTFTLWRALHEAGYSHQQTRTWCPTGAALRRRKAGTVTVTDPDAEPKKN